MSRRSSSLLTTAAQVMGYKSVKAVLGREERFALLVAALCHDLDHDGMTNAFHTKTLDLDCEVRTQFAVGATSTLSTHSIVFLITD